MSPNRTLESTQRYTIWWRPKLTSSPAVFFVKMFLCLQKCSLQLHKGEINLAENPTTYYTSFFPINIDISLLDSLHKKPVSKVTLDGGSNLTSSQEIHLMEGSEPEIGSVQFLGVLLPLKPPSKVTVLVVSVVP